MASPVCGLILLGNSGVGKSFLANRLLDDDGAFESRFSAKSITRRTEWKELRSSDGRQFYAVANIPGLIEANQSLVDENRHEIMKAFEQCPFSIVIFVFGHRNGRIPDEDLVAFERIDDAYAFSRESLILIVNGIPPDRPDGYEETTAQLLSELTQVAAEHIYFIEKNASEDSKRATGDLLYRAVTNCEPAHHRKKHDIQLITDEIAQLKAQSKQRQEQLWIQQNDEKNVRHRPITFTSELSPTHTSTSSMEPNETMSDMMDSNRQFNEWMDSQQVEFNETSAKIERLLHQPDRNARVRLADCIKQDSEKTQAMAAQLSLPPQQVVVVTKKKHDTPRRIIRQGFHQLLGFGEDDVPTREQANSPYEPTPPDDNIAQDHHFRGQASLPPHPYDPRSCKH